MLNTEGRIPSGGTALCLSEAYNFFGLPPSALRLGRRLQVTMGRASAISFTIPNTLFINWKRMKVAGCTAELNTDTTSCGSKLSFGCEL